MLDSLVSRHGRAEVAVRLGVTYQTVYNWHKNGKKITPMAEKVIAYVWGLDEQSDLESAPEP